MVVGAAYIMHDMVEHALIQTKEGVYEGWGLPG